MFTRHRLQASTPDDSHRSDPYALWEPLVQPDDVHVAPTTSAMSDESDYECRICLETPSDPCVTRCGHLYCLSCLRQWLEFSPKCPACKTRSTMSEVVPIFGVSRPASPTIIKRTFKTHRFSSSSTSTSTSSSDNQRSVWRRSTDPPFVSVTSPSPPSAPLLLSSPPPIHFTQEPLLPPLAGDDGEDDGDWDTDAELDFQLSQITSVKLPPGVSPAMITDNASQPFGRAFSVVALAVMLTVLLK